MTLTAVAEQRQVTAVQQKRTGSTAPTPKSVAGQTSA
jgi:hypothetical protein